MSLVSNFSNKELFFLFYSIVINITSFIMFRVDKRKSEKNLYRINENTLLLLCLFGGAIGGLMGMVVFKHKLGKKRFYIGIPVLIILNKFFELIITNLIK